MKTMKTNTIILIASLMMACITPAVAQSVLPWQSSAPMQNTGSKFTSRVIEVDAPRATCTLVPMGSTSTMMDVAPIATPELESSTLFRGSGPRKGFDVGGETGRSEEYPVGEPWVLLLFAAAAAGVIAYRRRRGIRSTLTHN